jgi:hypothetical protein
LKTKRETLAKERETHEEKKKKGEIPADAPTNESAQAKDLRTLDHWHLI